LWISSEVKKVISSFSLDEKEAKNQGFAGLLAKIRDAVLSIADIPF